MKNFVSHTVPLGRFVSRLATSFSKPILGYEAEALTELVYEKTVAINRQRSLDLRPGTERLLLAVSLAIAADQPKNATRVIDFGGACGVHYTIASQLFSDTVFRWAVVETPSMVNKARSLETESLRFFEEIGSAKTWLERVDLVNNNSALQYVEDPLLTVEELLDLTPAIILWERMMLANGATHIDRQNSMLFDHGPGPVPAGFKNRLVSQQITRLSRSDFLAAHDDQYRLRCRLEEPKFSTYLFSRRA